MEERVVIYNQGIRLFGNLNLPVEGAPVIILSHGLESSKDTAKWRLLSAKLGEAGFASLRFNYQGCGEGAEKSEGSFAETTLSSRVSDFEATVAFLQGTAVDVSRLGTVGSSFGGMVALSSGLQALQAMVLLSTPYRIPPPDAEQLRCIRENGYFQLFSGQRLKINFYDDLSRYHLLDTIKNTRCPRLIIHGSQDEIVPPADAATLFRHAGEPKRLHIIDGGNHVLDNPEHLGLIAELSREWFRQYL
jgi:fermentation-respiration switch protein FrsA (DUF1100 family)